MISSLILGCKLKICSLRQAVCSSLWSNLGVMAQWLLSIHWANIDYLNLALCSRATFQRGTFSRSMTPSYKFFFPWDPNYHSSMSNNFHLIYGFNHGYSLKQDYLVASPSLSICIDPLITLCFRFSLSIMVVLMGLVWLFYV